MGYHGPGLSFAPPYRVQSSGLTVLCEVYASVRLYSGCEVTLESNQYLVIYSYRARRLKVNRAILNFRGAQPIAVSLTTQTQVSRIQPIAKSYVSHRMRGRLVGSITYRRGIIYIYISYRRCIQTSSLSLNVEDKNKYNIPCHDYFVQTHTQTRKSSRRNETSSTHRSVYTSKTSGSSHVR